MTGDALPDTQGGSPARPSRRVAAAMRSGSSSVLLEQFYVTLRAAQQAIDRAAAPTDADHKIRAAIADLLDAPLGWRAAYEIEQLQCQLLTGSPLDTEITRRFGEAERHKLARATELKARLGPPEKWHELPDERKRAVLFRLVDDLQWFYTQRFERRNVARLLNSRVSKVFLAAFAVLMTVLIVQLSSLPAGKWEPASQPVPAAPATGAGGK